MTFIQQVRQMGAQLCSEEKHLQGLVDRILTFLSQLPPTTPEPDRVGVTHDDEGYLSWYCPHTGAALDLVFVDGHPPTLHLLQHPAAEQAEYLGYYDDDSAAELLKLIHLMDRVTTCH